MTATHVAIFLGTLRGGGAERVMVNLANRFAAWGRQVDMVLVWAEGPYLEMLDPRVRVVDLAVSSQVGAVPALARYLRRERPQVLLSAMDVFNVVALLARRLAGVRLPVVVTSHIHMSTRARQGTRVRDRLLPRLAGRVYRSADRIVAVSAGVADDLAETTGLARQRIDVLYNPVVTEELEARACEPVDHPWLAAGAPPVIVSVGALTLQKDHATVLRAFAHLRRPARLMILGKGPNQAALKNLACELGVVDAVAMPGFVDNPFAYMARAKLLVLSSAWEGLPTVLIEALACGCPVVSTDCPSGPREILEDGRYGILVPVGDEAALAAAIDAALDAPHDPVALKARAAAFAVEPVARRYLDLLDACCGHPALAAAAG
jgi:glycosyltransferase involved in cell wall biosynthesis